MTAAPPATNQVARGYFHTKARAFICLALAVVLYFIAGSTGSGFMFLLSSMMLTALLVGWIYPWISTLNLKINVQAPAGATAQEPFAISVVLQRRFQNRILSSICAPRQLLLRHCFDPTQQPSKTKFYEAFLDGLAGDKTTVRLSDSGLPRGVHHPIVAVSTAFPMGLIFRERLIRSDDEIVVYPVIHPMEGFFLYRLPSLGSGTFGFPREGSCRQSTFTRSLRRYVRGDSPRNIHWKSTARTGQLMVREFDAEGMPYFDIVLDLTASWSSSEQFELAVSTAASLVSLGQKMGISPELKLIPSLEELNLQLPASLPGYELQMEILARIQPRVTKEGSKKAQRAELDRDQMEAPDERTFKRSRERTPVVICPPDYWRYAPNSFVIEIATGAATGSGGGAVNRLSISSTGELQEI
jgi:hypothetical protein